MLKKEIDELNKKYSYKKGEPIYTSEQMIPKKQDMILCNKMDSGWKASIKDKWWAVDYEGEYTKHQENMLLIRDKLLSFAGEEVCLAFDETPKEIYDLLKRGQLWYGDRISMMKGEDSRCHKNSAECWNANKDKLAIVTGYALTNDGMWRQHSWCVWGKCRANRIVETTVARQLYYGIVLSPSECQEFYDMVTF
jgi:hypothetical protein